MPLKSGSKNMKQDFSNNLIFPYLMNHLAARIREKNMWIYYNRAMTRYSHFPTCLLLPLPRSFQGRILYKKKDFPCCSVAGRNVKRMQEFSWWKIGNLSWPPSVEMASMHTCIYFYCCRCCCWCCWSWWWKEAMARRYSDGTCVQWRYQNLLK